jgi:hypothetical protein
MSHPTHHVHLSLAQRRRLLVGQSIRIKHEHLRGGTIPLFVTPLQHRDLTQAITKGKGVLFKFSSPKQAEYHLEHGRGFWDTIKSAAKGALSAGKFIVQNHGNLINATLQAMQEMPRVLKEFIQKEGQKYITNIKLGRIPVIPAVKTVLNAISLGKLEQTQKQLNYNEIFHSFLIITLDGGLRFKLEKNQRVGVTTNISKEDTKENFDIPINRKLKFVDFIENTAKVEGTKLWSYDPSSQNCQRFCMDMVKDNNLLPRDPKTIAALTPQNGQQLINSLGSKSGIAKFVTDVAGFGDVLLHGGKISRKK